MIFILTSLSLLAWSDDLPRWVKQGALSDSNNKYVICSHDGIDPEEARQIAESKCLASAAKLDGVSVKLTQKTVQSLTGVDSSEVAEIQPLEVNVKCEWADRYLEKIKDGYRVWLRCKVSKMSITSYLPNSEIKDIGEDKLTKHVEATIILTTLPIADRIIVIGAGGERVIEPKSNATNINISNLDQKIEVKKSGYKNATVELPKNISHGYKIQKSILLDRN